MTAITARHPTVPVATPPARRRLVHRHGLLQHSGVNLATVAGIGPEELRRIREAEPLAGRLLEHVAEQEPW